MHRMWKHVLVAAAAFALPVGVSAQEAAPAPAPAQAAAPATEAQQIEEQLVQIRRQAMQDPELQAAQTALNEAVTAAMAAVDSSIPAKVERANAMPAEIAAAQQAGDNAKLNALAAEAQALQADFQRARAAAMRTPEIVAAREAFQAKVLAKMVEVNPEAQALLARLRELQGSQ